MKTTATWLRELGATRPMATASEDVLVLGEWHEGVYPITWRRHHDRQTRDSEGNLRFRETMESWFLFGKAVVGELTRADCERILRAGSEWQIVAEVLSGKTKGECDAN